MRLLFIEDAIQTRQMDKWVRHREDESVQVHGEAIQQLCALRLLVRPGGSEADDTLHRDALHGKEIKVGLNVNLKLCTF